MLRHYYEPNLTDFHTTAHNFDKEFKILQSLSKKGLIQLVLEPCLTNLK